MKFKRKECVFCGQPATTRDHIPPKGMFKKPRPVNLITVPSCADCNNNSNLDDQHLQNFTLAWDSERSQDALGVKDKVMRNIHRPESKNLRKAMAPGLKVVDAYTPSGLYLGNTLALRLDKEKIIRSITKIIHGLFWHRRKKRLPSNYEIIISSVDQLEMSQDSHLNFVKQLHTLTPIRIGDNAFNYAWIEDDEDENLIVWMIQFYGSFKFLGEIQKIEFTTPTQTRAHDSSSMT